MQTELEEPNAHVCFKVILTNLVLFYPCPIEYTPKCHYSMESIHQFLAYKGNSPNALEFSLILFYFLTQKFKVCCLGKYPSTLGC